MIDKFINKIHQGNSLDILRQMPDNSVESIITSPPYWQLRSYEGIPDYIWDGKKDCEHDFEQIRVPAPNSSGGKPSETNQYAKMLSIKGKENYSEFTDYKDRATYSHFCSKCGAWKGQLGLEPTLQLFLEHIWQIMDETYRILKPTGTAWINLGDTYGTVSGRMGSSLKIKNPKLSENAQSSQDFKQPKSINKCLLLIPHRFAIGCIDRGWIVRNDIIWAKRNGMPESCRDRFAKKHEYLFLMAKQQKYYFDLDGIREKIISQSRTKILQPHNSKYNEQKKGNAKSLSQSRQQKRMMGLPEGHINGKNPGDVSDFWDIPTSPSIGNHYASYNFKLIEKPIIAGCPEGGIVLDPFCGVGTTLVRALQLGRRIIGIDGSKEYCEIAEKKISKELNQLQLF